MRRTVLLVLTVLVLTASPAVSKAPGDDFYQPPSFSGGAPGDVLREGPTRVKTTPLGLVGVPVTARRLMYLSTARSGDLVPVTGTILQPRRPWHGPGPRPVIAYAIGTQGLADRCAASRQLAAGTEYEIPFIELMLAKGWTLVISDYPGLGTPGDHTYVDRVSNGRAVLDSVRAAQRVAVAPVPDDAPVAISGYSEGGNAAAGALELQPSYAPELDVVAGFAGAVPADFRVLARHLEGNLQAFLLGYTSIGMKASHPDLDLDALLSDYGRERLDRLRQTCVIDAILTQQYFPTRRMTADGGTITSLLDRPELAAIVDDMKLGSIAPQVPVLTGQSRLDEIMPFAQGRQLAVDWCARGAAVEFVQTIVPEHVGGAAAIVPKAIAWLSRRFAGEPFTSRCGTF